MKVLQPVKLRDMERERSEQKLSLHDFLVEYNATVPDSFPKATESLLIEFRDSHESLFKDSNDWTLGVHRKKLMDWLPLQARD